MSAREKSAGSVSSGRAGSSGSSGSCVRVTIVDTLERGKDSRLGRSGSFSHW